MKKVNRGKQFEDSIKNSFEKVHDISIDRLPDQMSGYAGSSNICDFILYYYPMQLYIECKATYGNTLSIHSNNPKRAYGDISNTQWEGLLEKEKIYGVAAGYIIWYIDNDMTYFVPAHTAKQFKDAGKKSMNIKDLVNGFNSIRLEGSKKRIFYDYDMELFLQEIFDFYGIH